MKSLIIIIFFFFAKPHKETGPKAQPMKSGIEILQEASYLTGAIGPSK